MKKPDATPAPAATFDGTYSGTATFPSGASVNTSARVVNGSGSGSWPVGRCGTTVTYNLSVDQTGNAHIAMNGWNAQCQPNPMNLTGHVQNNQLQFTFPYGGTQTGYINLARHP